MLASFELRTNVELRALDAKNILLVVDGIDELTPIGWAYPHSEQGYIADFSGNITSEGISVQIVDWIKI